MAGAAKFPASERLHGQGVSHIGTAFFPFEDAVVAIAALVPHLQMKVVAKNDRRQGSGIFEHESSAAFFGTDEVWRADDQKAAHEETGDP